MDNQDMGCLSALPVCCAQCRGASPSGSASCLYRTQKDLPEDRTGNSRWDVLSGLKVVWQRWMAHDHGHVPSAFLLSAFFFFTPLISSNYFPPG